LSFGSLLPISSTCLELTEPDEPVAVDAVVLDDGVLAAEQQDADADRVREVTRRGVLLVERAPRPL